MKILLLNQCFYPDVVSTAQHAQDLACALTAAGHEVTVIASSRGYDNSALRYRRSEVWKGIQIHRVPCLATGKGRRWARALNFASFFTSCAARLLFSRSFDTVIALTSPPLISVLAALFVKIPDPPGPAQSGTRPRRKSRETRQIDGKPFKIKPLYDPRQSRSIRAYSLSASPESTV